MSTFFTSLDRFILHFSKRYKWPILGLFLIGLLWAIHASLSPIMIKCIIDVVTDYSEQLLPYLLTPIAGYLGLELFLLALSSAYDYCILKVYPRLRADVIDEMYKHLQSHSYPFFQNHLAGTLSNKISDLSKGIISILTTLIDDFFSRSLLFLCGLATLFWVHPYFALALIVWACIFFTLSFHLSKSTEKYSVDFSEARSTAMGKVVDGFMNIFNIKIFATQLYEQHYLRKYLGEMIVKEQQMHWYMLKLKLSQNISSALLLFAMIFLLVYTRMLGIITVGDFALVLTLTASIVNQTYYLAIKFVDFSEDLGVCKQALLIFARSPESLELPHTKSLVVTQGKIVFDKVSFEYHKSHPIFKNLSFTLLPQEKIGIVGFSGSGKSTLAHLILGLYKVSKGHILIDDQDISTLSRSSIAEQIAIIPQDSTLFHRTVYENILYGKPTASEAEVIRAAQKAHCHSFIAELEEGYQTIVGERGLKLSGGQRQRIAIARAILKNAPILILDEATSALDSITEQQIQESLHYLTQGRTTLVIAHRLSTLHQMDRIIVFDKGEIIEEGSHAELLEKNRRYAQLWHLQVGEAPAKLFKTFHVENV